MLLKNKLNVRIIIGKKETTLFTLSHKDNREFYSTKKAFDLKSNAFFIIYNICLI